MNSKITSAYLLGIAMGIIIILFFSVINQSENPENTDNVAEDNQSEQTNTSMQIKVLQQQNSRLEKQLKDLKSEDKADETPVKLTIESEMSNAAIAEMLVSNGIYPHENDLLMILEMISFDKRQASEQLEAIGAVDSASSQLRAYTVYEDNRDEIAQSFIEKGLIQDQRSFEKLIYIFKDSTNIKPGEKIFSKNISLREIVDILAN